MVSLSKMVLNVDEVMLPNGLRIDEIRARGTGVQFNWEPFQLGVKQPADVEVRVSAASLAAFLNKLSPAGLTNCQVTIVKGQIYVEGLKQVFIAIKALVVCRLVIREGVQLVVELVEAGMLGNDIAGLVQQNLSSVNPILDCSSLPFKATLASVDAEDGWVTIKAHLEPLAVPV
jgi:hypothetical protein